MCQVGVARDFRKPQRGILVAGFYTPLTKSLQVCLRALLIQGNADGDEVKEKQTDQIHTHSQAQGPGVRRGNQGRWLVTGGLQGHPSIPHRHAHSLTPTSHPGGAGSERGTCA